MSYAKVLETIDNLKARIEISEACGTGDDPATMADRRELRRLLAWLKQCRQRR